MNWARTTICGAEVVAAGLICGCEEEHHHDHAQPVRVYQEPAPPPVIEYDYTYYDTGYYNGPYWVYRDREGHEYREMREEHERREHERHTANFREAHPPQGVYRRDVRHDEVRHDDHDHDGDRH
jgi:hypothetical protein